MCEELENGTSGAAYRGATHALRSSRISRSCSLTPRSLAKSARKAIAANAQVPRAVQSNPFRGASDAAERGGFLCDLCFMVGHLIERDHSPGELRKSAALECRGVAYQASRAKTR